MGQAQGEFHFIASLNVYFIDEKAEARRGFFWQLTGPREGGDWQKYAVWMAGVKARACAIPVATTTPGRGEQERKPSLPSFEWVL